MELRELLEIGPGLTALIGGGGKTTLMYHLASELRQQGTVLVCTTTKIWGPDSRLPDGGSGRSDCRGEESQSCGHF